MKIYKFKFFLIFLLKTLDFFIKSLIILYMKINKNIINSNCCSPVQSSPVQSSPVQSSPVQSSGLILNFLKFYVYLLIIKYYSIYILKTYSNSFLNLLIFTRQKAFIYLNVLINIYLMDIITQKAFYQIYFYFTGGYYARLFKIFKINTTTAIFISNGYHIKL